MSEEIAIKVENVSKDFNLVHEKNTTLKSKFTSLIKGKGGGKSTSKQHALKNISFEVKKEEFFGIVGRNGSGKSTLLKILAQIYQPTSGKVYTHGKLVPFIELGVGFNPELTGRENVYLNGAILGFSRQEIDDFYDEVVEFAELKQYMDKKLKNYSSGMQVRLAFSMAIRAKADVLLIDEVLAVGDADFQRKCFNYFKKLKSSGATVIFVTHDMNSVRQFCTRAMLIEGGEIIKFGDVEKVAQGYITLFSTSSVKHNMRKKKQLNSTIFKELNINIDDDINITGNIFVSKNIINPIFGFIVKDASKLSVLGANSQMINSSINQLSKNKTYQFKWSFPNILSDGEYKVDLALIKEDGVTVVEWCEEAITFTVKKKIMTPYITTPSINLSIEDRNVQ